MNNPFESRTKTKSHKEVLGRRVKGVGPYISHAAVAVVVRRVMLQDAPFSRSYAICCGLAGLRLNSGFPLWSRHYAFLFHLSMESFVLFVCIYSGECGPGA